MMNRWEKEVARWPEIKLGGRVSVQEIARIHAEKDARNPLPAHVANGPVGFPASNWYGDHKHRKLRKANNV